MLDFRVIKEINKKAIKSIKSDSDGELIQGNWKKFVFYCLFYAFPIALSVVSWIRGIEISNLQGYIATGIAIFTGLFFSLLLSIGAKVRAEKANNDIDQDNFQSFKTSMKQIADITLYVIILGVFIFLLLLLNNISKTESCVYVEQVFTAVVLFLLGRFIVSLFFMVQRLYFLVRDELNNIL
jgi:hypothetical protein